MNTISTTPPATQATPNPTTPAPATPTNKDLMRLMNVLDTIAVEGLDAVGYAYEEDDSFSVILSFGGPTIWANDADGFWTAYYHYQGISDTVSIQIQNKKVLAMLDAYSL